MTTWLVLWSGVLLSGAVSCEDEPTPTESLWQACRNGDVDTVKTLIDEGVDVNARTEFDATALYFAAGNDHADVCQLLVEAKAELDVADNFYGNTPISMAGWLGYAEPVRVLVKAGSTQVIGALMSAASGGHTDVIRVVLAEAELTQETLDGAWQSAATLGHAESMALLVEAGAVEGVLPTPAPPKEGEVFEARVEDRYVPVVDPAPWPSFRGPATSGIADGQHPPKTWNPERNVRWRSDVPGLGHSSPVVHGDRVYLTTAIGSQPHTGTEQGDRGFISAAEESFEHTYEVLCYHLGTGELLWRTPCMTAIPKTQRHWKATHANCTCAADGDCVVAFFGSEGLHCFDPDGTLRWSKDLGTLRASWFVDDNFSWGFASSPVLWEGLVFVQCDVTEQSFVACYDTEDGSEVWRIDRDEISSWGTPLLAEGESGAELILNGTRAVCAYDPDTGDELWRVRGNSNITVASPIEAGGLVYATGGYQRPDPIYAVRMGAMGDLTPKGRETSNEGLAWSAQRGGVYQPTPLAYRGRLYLFHDNGILACHDAETGERLYRERLSSGIQYTASPVAADGFLYFTDEEGTVHVLREGPNFFKVAENRVEGRTFATPAISNGLMLFRTEDALVAIGHEEAGEPR